MKRIRTRLAAVLAVCFLIFSVTAAAEAAYDGYIVCFKDDDAAARAEQLLDTLPVLYADDGEELAAALDPIYGGETLFTVESDALVELFEREGLLSYSEPDYYVTLYGYDYTAEPQFSSQWAHTATGIRAAWELGLYGNDVTVAVLDSGIYEHADLAENLLPGINYVKPNSVTPADPDDLTDTVGHGTKVAGVICAAANAKGVVGAAHRAKVLPLKVAGSSDFKNSYVAGAINQAIELGVDVISMSFGYNSDTDMASRTVKQAVKNALANNIIVVAAAGNDGNDPTKGGMYAYPASYDGVISVANLAQTATGYAVSSSSRHNDKVTIAAPGASILTTAVGGGYASVSGTSFSAPYVAAVAALAKSADKSLTPAHFEELLIQTADKSVLNGAERDDYFGYGMLNAGALLTTLAREIGSTRFLSPIDCRTDGGITVTVTDFSGTGGTDTLIGGLFSGKRPLRFQVLAKVLEAGASAEYDLADLAGDGILRCYLLDEAARPLSMVRAAKQIEN